MEIKHISQGMSRDFEDKANLVAVTLGNGVHNSALLIIRAYPLIYIFVHAEFVQKAPSPFQFTHALLQD